MDHMKSFTNRIQDQLSLFHHSTNLRPISFPFPSSEYCNGKYNGFNLTIYVAACIPFSHLAPVILDCNCQPGTLLLARHPMWT